MPRTPDEVWAERGGFPEIENDMVHRLKGNKTEFWRGVIYASLGWTFFVLMFTYWVVSNLS